MFWYLVNTSNLNLAKPSLDNAKAKWLQDYPGNIFSVFVNNDTSRAIVKTTLDVATGGRVLAKYGYAPVELLDATWETGCNLDMNTYARLDGQ